MLKTTRLGSSCLAVLVPTLVTLFTAVPVLAQSQEELEAYEAELIEYETELDERAQELDELEAELEKMEDELMEGTPSSRARSADEAEAVAVDEEVVEAEQAGEAQEPVEYGDFFVAEPAPLTATRIYDTQSIWRKGIGGLADLIAGNTAGLVVQPSDFNATALDLSVRGIGGTIPHQPTGDPAVGVFIDGVYIARSQGLTLDQIDLEQIEVLRGPQGVLSGRNTSGGAVHMRTRKPTGKFGVEQQLLFGGEYDEVKSVTHVNLPRIADLVNARVSYMLDDHKGWVVNPGQGSDTNDFWSRDNEAVRIAINLDDGGPFSISYSYDDAQITSTAPYFQAIDAGEARFQETARSGLIIPESEVDIQHHNQTTVISGSKATLTSTVGYRELDSREFTNFDGLFGSQVTPTASVGDRLEQDQFSIDLRLAGTARGGEVDYIVGAQNQRENVELIELSNGGSSSVESFAVYAQGIWGLNDRLDLTVGWRATRDEKSVESLRRDGQITGDQTKIDDDNTAYEVMLAYDLSEKMRSWLSLATGFKAAGASLFADNTNPYDAETSETIELGFAGTVREGKIDYSVVGFISEIDDRQVVWHDPDNLRFTDIVNDRGSNQVDGFEMEMAFRPLQAVQISATYSYLDTKSNMLAEPYAQAGTDFNFMPGAGPATLARIERAPRHSGSFEVDYNVTQFEAGDLGFHVEYLANSGYFFNPFNPEADSRDVLNVRVNMSGLKLEDDSGELAVSVWARNVLDDKYAVASQYVSEDSFRASQAGAVVSAFGEPATYGVDIRYMF